MLAVFIGVATCILTGVVAAGMRNDHADTYEYLRMSQRLSMGGAPVIRGRPPLLPLTWAWLWYAGGKTAVWVAAHAMQVLWVALAVVLSFLVLRHWVGSLAGGATALLCLDRVFIHFAPSALTDHLALAGFLGINLMWCQPAARRRATAAVAAGVAAGILTQAKYILALVPLSLSVAGGARGWRIRLWYAVGVALGMLVVRAFVESIAGQPVIGTLPALFAAYVQGAEGAYVGQFDWSKVLLPLRFVVTTASPGIVAAALIGVWVTGRSHAVLLVQFAMVMTILCFVLGEKEARYVLPVLPIVYAFGVVGLRFLWDAGRSHGGRLLGTAVLAAFLVHSVAGAVREWGDHLRGGVNRYPADEVAGRIGAVLDPGGDVSWRGGAYALYSSESVRMPGDHYYDTVRLGPAGVAFWLGRPCGLERRVVPILEGPLEERRAHTFAAAHGDGDVVVLAPPRGTDGGALELVKLGIQRLEPEAGVPGWERSVGSGGPAVSGEADAGFVLAYCRGVLRAALLADRQSPLCEDVEMLGPVTVVQMTVTRLIP